MASLTTSGQRIDAAGTVRTAISKAELLSLSQSQSQSQNVMCGKDPLTHLPSQTSQIPAEAAREVKRGPDPSPAELNTTYGSQRLWEKLYGRLSSDGKVRELAWKDQNVVLVTTTVSNSRSFVKRVRWRPAKTAAKASTSRRVFGDATAKESRLRSPSIPVITSQTASIEPPSYPNIVKPRDVTSRVEGFSGTGFLISPLRAR